MLMWVLNLGFAGSGATESAVDPNDFGSLPSIREDEPPEIKRRKRNRRYRYLAND